MNPIRRILSPFRRDSEWQARALDSLSLVACASGAHEHVELTVTRSVLLEGSSEAALRPEMPAAGALSFGE